MIKPMQLMLAHERVGRAYISGPMTGYEDFNFPAFNALAATMREQGWTVENPTEHGIVEGAKWGDYLRYDLARMATCEVIVLLPGWSQSRGALLERQVAEALGMVVTYAEVAEVRVRRDERNPLQKAMYVSSETGPSLKLTFGFESLADLQAARAMFSGRAPALAEEKPTDEVPDFTPGSGNKARRRAEAIKQSLSATPHTKAAFAVDSQGGHCD